MNDEIKCLVYVVTNLVTGKWYVGKTRATEAKRWKAHINTARNGAPYAISRSIRKHGPEAFERQVIAENLIWDEASNLERLWIVLLESHKQEFGYNLTMGGDGVRHNEATRKKVSEKLTGRTYSEETVRRMKESSKKKFDSYSAEDGDFSFRKDIPNKQVVEMYLSGASLPKIADHFKTNHHTIFTRLKRMGVPRRSHKESVPNKKILPLDEIISTYLSGVPPGLIADKFGVTRETIRKRLKKAGVVLRTKSQSGLLYNQRKSTGDTAIQNQRNQQNGQF